MLLLAALPEFVILLLLVILFATTVSHIFPAVGPSSPRAARPWDNPKYPCLAYTLPGASAVAPGTFLSHQHLDGGSQKQIYTSRWARLKGFGAHRADPARAPERDRPHLPQLQSPSTWPLLHQRHQPMKIRLQLSQHRNYPAEAG